MAERARQYEIGLRERQGITALGDRMEPVVQAGPFQGLRYPAERLAEVDAPVAKFLGVYEQEVGYVFEEPRARFVDVGCADGYYAAGMALRGARVIGFDIARSARELCDTVAGMNAVEVEIGKRFAPDDAGLVRDGLLLVDIEGGERDLFTPSVVEHLGEARVLVEVHEDFRPGTSEYLTALFAASHEVRRVDQQPRATPAPLREWPPEEVALALTEHRPPLMHWLDCVPR